MCTISNVVSSIKHFAVFKPRLRATIYHGVLVTVPDVPPTLRMGYNIRF